MVFAGSYIALAHVVAFGVTGFDNPVFRYVIGSGCGQVNAGQSLCGVYIAFAFGPLRGQYSTCLTEGRICRVPACYGRPRAPV